MYALSDGGVGAPPNIGPRRQSAELASEEATISISGVRQRAGLRIVQGERKPREF